MSWWGWRTTGTGPTPRTPIWTAGRRREVSAGPLSRPSSPPRLPAPAGPGARAADLERIQGNRLGGIGGAPKRRPGAAKAGSRCGRPRGDQGRWGKGRRKSLGCRNARSSAPEGRCLPALAARSPRAPGVARGGDLWRARRPRPERCCLSGGQMSRLKKGSGRQRDWQGRRQLRVSVSPRVAAGDTGAVWGRDCGDLRGGGGPRASR